MTTFYEDFAGMLPSVVQIAAVTVTPPYNDSTPGTAHPFPCYIEEKPMLITDSTGEQIVSSGAVYTGLASSDTSAFPVDSPAHLLTLTLPNGTTPRVLSVDRLSDSEGDYAVIVRF